jgi:hypothetical protein
MTLIEILNLIGLVLNITGSTVLALSLSKYLTLMHGALAFHDIQIKALVRDDSRIVDADVAALLTKGVKNSRTTTSLGLILIVTGFVFQAIPFALTMYSKYFSK